MINHSSSKKVRDKVKKYLRNDKLIDRDEFFSLDRDEFFSLEQYAKQSDVTESQLNKIIDETKSDMEFTEQESKIEEIYRDAIHKLSDGQTYDNAFKFFLKEKAVDIGLKPEGTRTLFKLLKKSAKEEEKTYKWSIIIVIAIFLLVGCTVAFYFFASPSMFPHILKLGRNTTPIKFSEVQSASLNHDKSAIGREQLINGTEKYDPLNTVLALNACIVSIAKIISYNDRIVLDQEYSRIINNINFGNIEDDDELVELHMTMMDNITNSKLREEEKDRFLKAYNKKAKKSLYQSLAGISIQGLSPAGIIVNGITSIGSAYFSYQNTLDSYRDELDNQMWGLEKEKIIDLNYLQKNLLKASWRLERKYNLPDHYRLSNKQINEFMSVIKSDNDNEKRFRRLDRMKDAFLAYPPFWYYYGIAAQNTKKTNVALDAFNKYEAIHRDINRIDPYYASMCMNKIKLLKIGKDSKEIGKCLKIIERHSENKDWTNFLFAALYYYQLGDISKAQNLIQRNIDNDHELELHKNLIKNIQNKTKINEGFQTALLKSMVDNDTLKNQELLELYGKVNDEFLLNKLREEIVGVKLIVQRKAFRTDELNLFLPYKWIMGQLGYEQDNVYYLKNMSDDFKIRIFSENDVTFNEFNKNDIYLESDDKEKTKLRIESLEKQIEEYEESDSIDNLGDIQGKLTKTKKLEDKKTEVIDRKISIKERNIKFHEEKQLFELYFKSEMDDIDEQRKVHVSVEHPIYKLQINFRKVADIENWLEKNTIPRYLLLSWLGAIDFKDTLIFEPDSIEFNNNNYFISDGSIKKF